MIDLMTYSEVEEVSGAPGRLPGAGPAARRAAWTSTPASPATPARDVCPVARAQRVRRRHRRRARRSTSPSRRRCRTPTSSTRRPAPTCRATARSAAPASRSAPRTASTSTSKDEIVELEVGNIIVATGYDVFDAAHDRALRLRRAAQRAHRPRVRAPDQRLRAHRRQDRHQDAEAQQAHEDRRVGLRPRRARRRKSVAIIHCVGSRDANYNPYCSRVCCMYSLKFAHLVQGEAARRRPATSSTSTCAPSARATRSSSSASRRRAPSSCAAARPRSTEEDGQMVVKGEDILSDQRGRVPGGHGAPGRRPRAGRRAPTSWPRCSASRATTTAGSASSTTTPTRPTPSAAASSWPASARGRRTSPTRWPRPRPWPPACSRASSAAAGLDSRAEPRAQRHRGAGHAASSRRLRRRTHGDHGSIPS